MTDIDGRRPLKTRQAGLAKRIAYWLSQKQITPNQISIASVGFALLAALCLLLWSKVFAHFWLWPLLAAVFIQCRLLCNLFDGMVAVEGGKGTPSGELFNDIPDRIADALILIAAGYAIGVVEFADSLGWCAALLAVMTAYVRALNASIGAPIDFQGPMAKPHRMALLTAACVLSTFEGVLWPSGYALLIALSVIVIGCMVTLYRRIRSAYRYLEQVS